MRNEISLRNKSTSLIGVGLARARRHRIQVDKGLKGIKIAIDGIAVIVNKDNSLDSITSEQVKSIFTGKVTDWSQVK